ncbi:hypothetical protein RCL1_007194 [Eukaryota sp. TZLM3-RCL]
MVSEHTDLANFFEADSCCIVGASTKPGTAGYVIVEQMTSRFKGKLFLVNPKGGELFGLPLYKSPSLIPEPCKLCILVTSAKFVPPAMKEALEHGMRYFVVISGGFAEIDEEGAKLQASIVEMAKQYGARVVGPNCVGLYSCYDSNIDTVFLPIEKLVRPGPGGISLFSQSGALVAAIMNELINCHMTDSVARILSFGNACDITEIDALEYLSRDPQTKIIWSYLEGFRNGAEYLRKLRQLCRTKPVITIKSNRTSAGAHASASHSASLAANDKVTDQLLATAGCIRAMKWTDLFDCGRAFVNQPLPAGRRVLITTNGGGCGVMLCDALDDFGLPLADISAETKANFRKVFPPFYPCENPFDLTGSASVDDYIKALKLGLDDTNVDAVICIILTCVPNLPADELVEKLTTNYGKVGDVDNRPAKTMLFVVLGGTEDHIIARGLSEAGLPVYDTEVKAASVLSTLVKYKEFLDREATIPSLPEPESNKRIPEVDAIIEAAKKDGRDVLLEPEAADVFRAIGITMPDQFFARSVESAVEHFTNNWMGQKIVMKLVSPKVIHKSDANAVFVGLKTVEEVRSVAEDLFTRFAELDCRGVLMYPLVPKGTEVIVGIANDPTFGPLVLAGMGGVLTEVLEDVGFALCPANTEDATHLINNLKSQKILDGFRGAPAVNKSQLADILVRLSGLADAYRGIIGEVDVNPIISYQDGDSTTLCAVDARIILA